MDFDIPGKEQTLIQVYDVPQPLSLYRGGACSMNLVAVADEMALQLVGVRGGTLAGEGVVGEQFAARDERDLLIEFL